MEFPQLKRIVEAALLASSAPLSLPQLFTLFGEDEQPSHDDLARALEELARDSEGRGVELKEVASGFRYQVRAEVNGWVSRLWTERQTRYSRAQLETLALIAYRQPITRGEIENIRGVAVSSNIIKTLEEREWIRTVGHRDVPGKPELFGTTRVFLDYFNLKSLDELPPLAEIRDLSDFDPQLGLAPVAIDEAGSGEDGDSAAFEAAPEAATEARAEPQAEAGGPAADAPTATAPADAADELPSEPVTQTTEPTEHETHATGVSDAQPETHETGPVESTESTEFHQEHGLADEGDATTTDADTAPAPSEHTP
ncbi:MAG: SMC-Scp complex subunit ScpB [Rudaea sp.]|uniref:SMC-Scp complex subunit ScpB n=1 Tax=unclassified Rudaea TaxID=2627037 RepID=UPI0010F9BE0F|nr:MULTISPECIES: SMC-Scp complex subunit ScpB [unclassified Rudaea]MBN8887959.1 SMC-Scp complex subunit ScpB [Rudaea sp.]